MTDWEDVKAGDLITVESSDRRQEVRGYVVGSTGNLYLHAGHETAVRKYREWGWELTARRTPIELPDKPGTVIAIGDWWLVRLRPYESAPSAWELLPAPNRYASDRMNANGARAQCVYDDDWVLAEAEQEGGYEIISQPTY